MSLASLKRPPSAKPAPSAKPEIDLGHSFDGFAAVHHPDGHFLFRRIEESLLHEAPAAGSVTLDVACGAGKLAARIAANGGQAWGLEPSAEMLELSGFVVPPGGVALVRGIAETLPFSDDSFDSVLCQGALDHFAEPAAFMREAARIVKPGGRVVVALANYESLSCRIGRLGDYFDPAVLRRSSQAQRPYWQPPSDHYHTGTLSFVRGLGGDALRLERCYGISLLWLAPGWGPLLQRLPRRLADVTLAALDRIGHKTPALADIIVSVWRPGTERQRA